MRKILCLLSPRISHRKQEDCCEARAREGVHERAGVRPRARTYTREGVVVCCLHRLVVLFRRCLVHIVTFFTFFSIRVPQGGCDLRGVTTLRRCPVGCVTTLRPHTAASPCVGLIALRAFCLSEAVQGMLFQYEHSSVTAFPVGVFCQLLTAFCTVNKKPAKVQIFCIYYTIYMRESALLLQGAGGQGVGWWGAA